MGLFDFFKTKMDSAKESPKDLIYNLLFCDNLDLFKTHCKEPRDYPWSLLFSEQCSVSDLQQIIDDVNTETRVKILAYNQQKAMGHCANQKDILAVIVEVGLDNGLDVLASFKDGSARYLNQSGKIIVWDKKDEASTALTTQLFKDSYDIVSKIGVWDKPRRPKPIRGNARISFLVSDGLYFGEAPMNILFNDPLSSTVLISATALMNYLMQRANS